LLCKFEEVQRALEPFLEIVLRLAQRLGARQGLGFGEGNARLLEQDDPVAHDVDEEITPHPELVVHVLEAVNDEADGRPQRLPQGQFLEQSLLGLGPEFGDVGQLLAVDHDEQIIIGKIAPDRILHPVAPRIASKEDDLQKPAAAKPRHRPPPDREIEALADQLHHELELASLPLGQMLSAGLHPLLASLQDRQPASQ
jgi:hypothetical protein